MRGAWQGRGTCRRSGEGHKLSAIAEFDSVGLRYGTGAEVLRDLDFNLGEGGFYFLTGPSGAGKTSLLKLLYLAQRPTRGRIRLFGSELTEAPREALPQYRRRIGVVFQDFRLVRHLSAFDNVALPLRIAGANDESVEGPVREMLAWVGPAAAAAGRQLMLGWLFATPAERRLLGEARLRGPTAWVVAIMSFSIMIIAAAGLALANTAGVLSHAIQARYSVEIPGGAANLA